MPRGPEGQWRPAGPVAAGVHIGKLATGEINETYAPPARPDPVGDSRRASKAGKARASKQTPEQRRELAQAGATARWGAR